LPRAEEKTQVPRAALTAAERPQEKRQQDGPLKNAAAMGSQDILASANRSLPCGYLERNRIYLGHKTHAGSL
jgi:hypothetical protein